VRNRLKDKVLKDGRIYYGYDLQEGDTAEIIADKYYGDAGLHWVVLMMNTTADGRFDIGMDYNTFVNYVQEKYQGMTMNTNSFSGDIIKGAYIVGATSGAEGIVLNWNAETGRISIQENQGQFQKGEQATTKLINGKGELLVGSMQFGQYRMVTLQATHHYEDTVNGVTLDYEQFLETPVSDRREVSNLIYEQEENQYKRTIALLKPEYIPQVVKEMKDMLDPKKTEV
jgi:hypothetical protein